VDHAAPPDSAAAFPDGAILLVPLRVASGVRIRILEAWARGVPVVATSAAARGLGGEAPLVVADDAAGFVQAVDRLAAEPVWRTSLVEKGRQRLREAHAPAHVAARLAEIYQRAPRMGAASVRSTIERSTAIE
jgi:glycosyltransferase involved in cell wall biosynthesis